MAAGSVHGPASTPGSRAAERPTAELIEPFPFPVGADGALRPAPRPKGFPGAGAFLLGEEAASRTENLETREDCSTTVAAGGKRVSWPSVIILVPAQRRPSFEGRIRSLELVPDPVTGDERLYLHGYSYCIDLSGGILADYEPEEIKQVKTRIGEPYAVYVSCQSMDAARAFLRDVLPGVDGLVDTNHYEILQASEFLTLVDRYPEWDWRRQASTDLQ
ncbi:hypothetical protein [Streptomyces sp. NPDC056255]|uniref:hypothetical protein n=1 Tax=Streptomyces sp. NPDC056255 TaxID=3345764 RepID=UPI0035DA1026